MPDIQFFQTRMGQRFYESTLPELVRQITRLNDLLEQLGFQVAHQAVVPRSPEGSGSESLSRSTVGQDSR